MAAPPNTLPQLRDFLRDHLLDNIIPFWLRHAIDPAGGINTCIQDDGSIVNRDKWLWSQWRAVWVFSRLYNQIEKRAQWLEVARHIYAFASRHGWDERADGWVLRVGHDGAVQAGCDSIYVDAFAIYGLTELYLASRDEAVVKLLRKTADSALRRLEAPHDQIPHFPYPIPPGARVHGLPMIFSQVFWEAGEALNDERYRSAAVERQRDIFVNFYRPDRDMLVERIAADGSEYPPPLGTAVVPGHVVEDMWFQMQIARDRGDRATINKALRLTRRHLELGWDQEFGGILLAIDADGRSEVGWNFADSKLWWPQTEALYALLLAHELSGGEPWCMEWYRRVHEYSFARYPVPEHGEWTQKLDRQGRPMTSVVALPVKDPFHLPRALILSLDVLGRIVPSPGTPGEG